MSTIETQNFKDLATSKSIDAAYVTDGTAKVWVHYNQISPSVVDSLNNSSVTDNSIGFFTINHTNNFGSADLLAAVSSGGSGLSFGNSSAMIDGRTVSSIPVFSNNSSYLLADLKANAVSIFGDLA